MSLLIEAGWRKYFYLILLVIAGGVTTTSGQVIVEAENAEITPGLTVLNSVSGYSGTGYVGNFSNDNDTLTFRIDLSQESKYNIWLGYSAPYGEKVNTITINGNPIDFWVGQSSSFQEKHIARTKLIQGENEITVTKSWGWINVDYLRIVEDSGADTEFSFPDDPVNTKATIRTRRMYHFLKDHFGKQFISGVMTLNSFDESDWLKEKTGKEPALLGLDFMNCNRGYSWYDNYTPVNDARTWYDRNGIPVVCWHWRDPSRNTEAFYTKDTSFDVSKIVDENSAEYKAMLGDIDFIAGLLKKIEAEVPLLWRPLHEASGGWFWWGAKGPEPCKKLWQVMYDRLVNHHGINNLIWVWTTDTYDDNQAWYPGDEFVDILGADIYAPKGDFSSRILTFEKIKDDFKGRKMITLSECAVVPDPAIMIADHTYWSWFMPWYGDFVRNGEYNPLNHWQNVMNHEKVITLDEMPSLKDYVTSSLKTKKSGPEEFKVTLNLETGIEIDPGRYTDEFDFWIFDLSGRQLLFDSGKRGTVKVCTRFFPTGIVLAVIRNENGFQSFKLVNNTL